MTGHYFAEGKKTETKKVVSVLGKKVTLGVAAPVDTNPSDATVPLKISPWCKIL